MIPAPAGVAAPAACSIDDDHLGAPVGQMERRRGAHDPRTDDHDPHRVSLARHRGGPSLRLLRAFCRGRPASSQLVDESAVEQESVDDCGRDLVRESAVPVVGVLGGVDRDVRYGDRVRGVIDRRPERDDDRPDRRQTTPRLLRDPSCLCRHDGTVVPPCARQTSCAPVRGGSQPVVSSPSRVASSRAGSTPVGRASARRARDIRRGRPGTPTRTTIEP